MISTIVKKEVFKGITSGTDSTFYRERSLFWDNRLLSGRHGAVGLLCGREYRIFKIKNVEVVTSPFPLGYEAFKLTLGGECKRLVQLKLYGRRDR
jgi:hypothetical protein